MIKDQNTPFYNGGGRPWSKSVVQIGGGIAVVVQNDGGSERWWWLVVQNGGGQR